MPPSSLELTLAAPPEWAVRLEETQFPGPAKRHLKNRCMPGYVVQLLEESNNDEMHFGICSMPGVTQRNSASCRRGSGTCEVTSCVLVASCGLPVFALFSAA